MEYIDFVKRKVQLHHEIENAIKEMMMEKGVTEIDLLKDEESFDAGWLIRSIGDTNANDESIQSVKGLSMQRKEPERGVAALRSSGERHSTAR